MMNTKKLKKHTTASPEAKMHSAIEAFSKWNPADIKLCLRELKNLGFIESDILGNITLTEAGIEYMESKPKEYFTRFAGAVKDLLSLVIPLIPT